MEVVDPMKGVKACLDPGTPGRPAAVHPRDTPMGMDEIETLLLEQGFDPPQQRPAESLLEGHAEVVDTCRLCRLPQGAVLARADRGLEARPVKPLGQGQKILLSPAQEGPIDHEAYLDWLHRSLSSVKKRLRRSMSPVRPTKPRSQRPQNDIRR